MSRRDMSNDLLQCKGCNCRNASGMTILTECSSRGQETSSGIRCNPLGGPGKNQDGKSEIKALL